MVKADYVYTNADGIINIVDLNLGNMSVTNDAENVLTEINDSEEITDMRVVYIDSEEELSEMIPVWESGKCVSVTFKPFVP
jgi:hypothetical protein